MRNKILIGLVALGVFACTQKGDPFEPLNSKRYVKFYGSSKEDQAFDFLQTSDEGFIIVGARTERFSNDYVGDQQFYVLKVDKFGNKQWDVSLGDSLKDQAHSVHITSDGSYMVLGTATISGGDTVSNQTNMYLVKINVSGDTVWTNNRIGNSTTNEEGNAITELASGDFILVGSTDGEVPNINEAGVKDQYIVRTDVDGNIVDFGQDGGRSDDYLTDVFIRNNGGEERLILLGERESDFGDKNITITTRKPDVLKGAVDNESAEGGDFDDIPGRIYDGGDFILMVGSDGIATNTTQARVISYQFDGKNLNRSGFDQTITNSTWQNTFGNSVVKSWEETGFVVLSTGETDGTTNILIDLMTETGATDSVFVSQEYGLGQNNGVKIIRTADFGYAALGNTKFGSDQKFILLKMDKTGSVE